jgi:hypothetical protein
MSADTFAFLVELIEGEVATEHADGGVYILCARCHGRIGDDGRIALEGGLRALCPMCCEVERPDHPLLQNEFVALLLNRAGCMVRLSEVGGGTHFAWMPIAGSRS